MIAVHLTDLSMSLAKLKKVRQRVKELPDERFRQKLYYLAELAIKVSPQFSGDFASNWTFAIDGNMPVYRPLPGAPGGVRAESYTSPDGHITYRENPHKAGDPEAVGLAMSRMMRQLRGVTIKSNVHLVNASPLDTDGTHMTGPDGRVPLRPENLIPGRVRIESYLKAQMK